MVIASESGQVDSLRPKLNPHLEQLFVSGRFSVLQMGHFITYTSAVLAANKVTQGPFVSQLGARRTRLTDGGAITSLG
jgi:hypothetical protein